MKVLRPQTAAVSLEGRTPPHRIADASAQPFASRDERPEIEGLRGIAILSLLAIHVAPSLSKGGAIGIDIFFVVSGYLLARALLRQETRAIGWHGFLSRRLQRAVPALVAMLIGCLAFATLFTLPRDLHALGNSMAWGASLLTNLDAWRRSVPIDAAQALDPLSHLWQVAAIAQGGLLLALMTWALRPHLRLLVAVISVTGLASFAFSVWAIADAPGAAFYLLAGRWWELAAGAGLALCLNTGHRGEPVEPDNGKLWSVIAPQLGWLALTCFMVAVLQAGNTPHYPGLWPVAGALCLLAAGPRAWLNRHVLAHPVLRFYGRVSYPLYLWHWPVLCFPLLLGVPLSVDVRVLILIASVVLAGLTHELLEKPVAMLKPSRRLAGLLLATLAACIALGTVVVATDGLRFTFPAELQALAIPRTPSTH